MERQVVAVAIDQSKTFYHVLLTRFNSARRSPGSLLTRCLVEFATRRRQTAFCLLHHHHRRRRTPSTGTMAAVARRPLYPRVDIPVAPSTLAAKSPNIARKALGGIINLKRARSPEPHATRAVGETSVKRPKASVPLKEKEKEREPTERTKEKRGTRAAQDDEFKAKYTKAFPSWSFYFEVPDLERSDLQQRILTLGGVRLHCAYFVDIF